MPRPARRHGTRSMYSAGCRGENGCEPCLKAAVRALTDQRIRAMNAPLKVPVVGVRRRIQALRALGWPLATIADELGVTVGALGSLLYKDRTLITRLLHDRVSAVYDHMSATPGPSQRARDYAVAHGWAPPLSWDDDTIDDPAAAPVGVPTDRASHLRPYGFDLDEWARLVQAGEDPERAAGRCGVSLTAVERRAWRVGRPDLASVAARARKRWAAA